MVSFTRLFYENARRVKHNFPEQKVLIISQEELECLHDENWYMSVLEPKQVEGMEVVVHG